jgi:hypothetical protein
MVQIEGKLAILKEGPLSSKKCPGMLLWVSTVTLTPLAAK